MPGLVPGIHAFLAAKRAVDGRDEPGHDDGWFCIVKAPKRCSIPGHLAQQMGVDPRPLGARQR